MNRRVLVFILLVALLLHVVSILTVVYVGHDANERRRRMDRYTWEMIERLENRVQGLEAR
jgi:hypothetical protein